MCWYCNKELIEPTIAYKRRHKKLSKKTDMTVHMDCYRKLNGQRNRYLTRGYGSISQ